MNNRGWWMGLIVVAVIGGAALFWHSGRTPLTNWDEGIYSDVALTMHQGGSWWLPEYHGTLFLEKPPLTMWLMNISFSWFGVTELAVRWWSAVAGVLTAMLITMWTWQVSRKTAVATLAGLLFVSGRFMFFHAFRTGDTDALLVLFFTAALFTYWRTKADQRWWWLFGVATGLAVMTKSFIGLLPAVIVTIDLILSRSTRQIDWRQMLKGVGLFSLMAGPWHVAVALTHGSALWHQVIGFNLVERGSTIIASIQEPWWWYGKVIYNFWFPAAALISLALILVARRWRNGAERLLLIWPVIVFFTFALAQTKYDHYIQPAYPALAMLVALMLGELWQSRSTWKNIGLAVSAGAIIFSAPPRLAHVGWLWKITPFGWLPTDWTSLGHRLIVAAVIGLVGIVLMTVFRRGGKIFTAIVIAHVLVLSLGWQYSYIKHLPTTSAAKNFSNLVRPVQPGGIDVLFSHQSEPAAYFYLDRQLPARTVELFKNQPPTAKYAVKKSVTPIPTGYTVNLDQGGFQLLERK